MNNRTDRKIVCVFRILFQILFLPIRLPFFLWKKFRAWRIGRNHNLHFRIPAQFSSVVETGLIGKFLGKEKSNYFEFLKFLELVRKDNRLKRIGITIPDIEGIDRAKTQEIQRAIERIVESGKRVSCFVEAGGLNSLLIASAASIRVSSKQSHFLTALPHSETRFVKGLLGKLGITIEVHSAGKYKSAGEIFSRSKLSTAAKENQKQILLDSRNWFIKEFKRTVGLDSKSIQKTLDLFKKQSISTALELQQTGFFTHITPATSFPFIAFYKEEIQNTEIAVERAPALHSFKGPGDRESDQQEITEETELALPQKETKSLDANRFLRAKSMQRARLFGKRYSRKIAILSLEGMIISGKPDEEAKSSIINAYGYANVLDSLIETDEEAVFLYINSPGGSSDASEILYQKIEALSRAKPVFAVLGGVAASGGYYMACAANRIYSSDSCLTGSIGVIRMRPKLNGLYRMLGITTERMHFDPTTDILSESGPLSKASLKLLNRNTDEAYKIFLERVAIGRGKTISQVKKQAEGRVFSAPDFEKTGMLDDCFTLYEAVHAYRVEAGIKPHIDIDFVLYPQVRMDIRTMLKQEMPVTPFTALLKELQKSGIFYWNPLLDRSML